SQFNMGKAVLENRVRKYVKPSCFFFHIPIRLVAQGEVSLASLEKTWERGHSMNPGAL
ncbi:MAG TPA: hypothetical protein HPP59_05110, partial [Deltaproteobacteria bacterium]|nr:hypothetical protein [Deltaproteobacteria bacterium]